jgi:hypothetical protein
MLDSMYLYSIFIKNEKVVAKSILTLPRITCNKYNRRNVLASKTAVVSEETISLIHRFDLQDEF